MEDWGKEIFSEGVDVKLKKKQIYYLLLHFKITPALQATKNENFMVNISLHYLPHLDGFFCCNSKENISISVV